MAQSLANAAVRTHANPRHKAIDELRAGDATLRIDAKNIENRPDSRRIAARIVRNAMRTVDLSQKAFALGAQQSESVVSEALGGTRNLAFEWLVQQDVAFLSALIEEVQREKGITAQSKREAKRHLAVALLAQILDLMDEGAA